MKTHLGIGTYKFTFLSTRKGDADALRALQVMLWERKIHLEKEMQEALDPSVGQAETTMMKKEIHRMELRCDHNSQPTPF